MSNKYSDYDKGSSRSTGDDSRRHEGRHENRARGYERTRSRSPRRGRSPDSRSSRHDDRHRSSRDRDYDAHQAKDCNSSTRSRHDREGREEEVPVPPPPPRITKISIDLSKPKTMPIKMNLGSTSKLASQKAKPTVASVFNADDDTDDDEEMPAEARMRMRNIGRDTPTSAGPNSFGKTKHGFCDVKKVFEKNLKQALEKDGGNASTAKPIGSFPQTIYKIKP